MPKYFASFFTKVSLKCHFNLVHEALSSFFFGSFLASITTL